MNIFYLDKDPIVISEMMCDKHNVKMILESAQMLSTAHRVLDGDEFADQHQMYKATHKNHPSAIWARSSDKHYMWLYELFCALSEEYQLRYGKEPKDLVPFCQWSFEFNECRPRNSRHIQQAHF